MKYGIKETSEMLDLVKAIPPAVRAGQNGGWAAYIGPITMLPNAIGGADEIPNELGDLDDQEAETLIDKYEDVFNNPEDREIFAALVRLGRAVKDRLRKEDEGQALPRVVKIDVS